MEEIRHLFAELHPQPHSVPVSSSFNAVARKAAPMLLKQVETAQLLKEAVPE